ncbi:Oxidative stress-induced growth inhibitor 1 [Talaromyces islandicus]|uniref:Oxidative stress-induced growth inhibitor 1 n=1 Tax=Talaromyces islandicus TaxID=28573 RepID=A0A0U1MAF9_TALIS|nr:Oxidative stress-induced growth inhibitor 1 [Talaromyces islandicus]
MPPLPAADTEIDTIIIGNGPSSMILSYILHGHIPYYKADPPHPDPLLHAKLLESSPCLLRHDLDTLTHHFAASRLSYSTQALPINVLLDTLLRPHGETDDLGEATNLEWQYKPHRAVPHLVIGNASGPGGLWAVDDPVPVSWDIGTLSYAGMLSLPGYTFAAHYRKSKKTELAPFTRPSRKELAEYLRIYPEEAGISDSFLNSTMLDGIERTGDGFYVRSHRLRCKHLVLATGIFSHTIKPPPVLMPLTTPHQNHNSPKAPLLVIGSGFTAADAIISAPPNQPILHVFRWNPDERPSPLRACHQQAYPEYAGIYRLMKRAALAKSNAQKRPKARRLASTSFLESRDWDEVYEGIPYSEIENVQMKDGQAIVTFLLPDGSTLDRAVCGLTYGVGRRGSLDYLDPTLRAEVLKGVENPDDSEISAKTLRNKVIEDLEVAPDVFVIGSLTGDSLIRFAFGGCVYAASTLITDMDVSSGICTPKRPAGTPTGGREALLNGVDGHGQRAQLDDSVSKTLSCRTDLGSECARPRMSSWWTALCNALFR